MNLLAALAPSQAHGPPAVARGRMYMPQDVVSMDRGRVNGFVRMRAIAGLLHVGTSPKSYSHHARILS